MSQPTFSPRPAHAGRLSLVPMLALLPLLGAVSVSPALAQVVVPGTGRGASSTLTQRPAVEPTVPVRGHFPELLYAARPMSRVPAEEMVPLAIALPLHHKAELSDLLRRLYDPSDPAYGKFLTPDQFTERFGPTRGEYQAVAAFAQAHGLTVTGTHPNRTLLNVEGPAGAVEQAFRLHLIRYQQSNGRVFRAPDAEPSVPQSLANVISGVVGLDTAAVWRPYAVPMASSSAASPLVTGSGPGGGLTPSDIKTAYGLNGVPETGSGQTLGLFELDGYKATDISTYKSTFGLPNVPLQNVTVDGYSGAAGSGAAEVTLDIELQIALAPGASKVVVYEGPNSGTGVLDTYNRIATDNLAKQVSTSWGLAEGSTSASMRSAENTTFKQMAAQGQSIYAASGDSGAYDNGSTLSVDDPASQPYMTGVGGTKLATNGAGGAWLSETTWNGGSIKGGGGGGGISSVWAIPSYQSGVVSTATKGSTTMRNVPDVSLDANPYSGYAIYYNGRWALYGGTSCASPLWAAFTAIVNQRRLAHGSGYLGFANPPLYTIGKGTRRATDFHDIADNSTNLYYPAVTGYDLATGWGTINGANLLADLAPTTTTTVTVPAAPTGLAATPGSAQVALSWAAVSGATSYNVYRGTTAGGESTTPIVTGITTTKYTNTGLTNGVRYYYKVKAVNSAGQSAYSSEVSAVPVATTQILGNPGFENGSANPAPWSPSAGVIDSSTSQPAHSGSWKAWLDGYGTSHTDTLSQQVSIASTATKATLTFWLHIDSAEASTTTAYDTLKVQVRNSSGTVLATLATYSNLNKASGYQQRSFDLTAYKGQTIRVYLLGVENASNPTSFVADDFALTVQ